MDDFFYLKLSLTITVSIVIFIFMQVAQKKKQAKADMIFKKTIDRLNSRSKDKDNV